MENRFRPFSTYPVTVPAGDELTLNVSGTFVTAWDANLGSFEIAFDDDPPSQFFAGAEARLEAGATFKKLRISNSAGSPLTVTIATAWGEIRDRRLTLAGTGLPIESGSTFAGIADVTLAAGVAGLLAAGDSNRKTLLLTNRTGAAIRVAGSTVGAALGLEVADGASLSLDTSAAVYAYSAGGGTVALSEIKA